MKKESNVEILISLFFKLISKNKSFAFFSYISKFLLIPISSSSFLISGLLILAQPSILSLSLSFISVEAFFVNVIAVILFGSSPSSRSLKILDIITHVLPVPAEAVIFIL